MKVGVYARKSKYSEAGDSVENQVHMCKQYCKEFTDVEFIEYKDDGWSGSSTNRPYLKKLMEDIELGELDCVVVYRLDRISRNILDFSNLVELMNSKEVQFISIKEQFDTSTPMGRAMMYISSVFAQLERETIAERIKDNMYKLAEKGIWLGGKTPYGYKSVKVEFLNGSNNKTSHCLEMIKDEAEVVKNIYSKFLELKSIEKLSCYLSKIGYKTRNGIDFNTSSLSLMLRSTVYVKCNKEVCERLKDKGINVIGDPDGNKGILSYGKCGANPIYSISSHQGIIEGSDWLKVQTMLDENTNSVRLGTGHTGVLRGKIKCSLCGSNMGLSYKVISDTVKTYYYVCSKKRRLGKKTCSCKNINGYNADELIFSKLLGLGFINAEDVIGKNRTISDEDIIRENILNFEREANKIMKLISATSSEKTQKRLLYELESIDKDIEKLNEELKQFEDNCVSSKYDISKLSVNEKHSCIKKVVDHIIWESEEKSFTVKFNDDSIKDIIINID